MIIVWFLFLLCFSYLIPCPLPPTHDPVSCINFVKHSMFSLIYSLCVFWMFPSFCGIFFFVACCCCRTRSVLFYHHIFVVALCIQSRNTQKQHMNTSTWIVVIYKCYRYIPFFFTHNEKTTMPSVTFSYFFFSFTILFFFSSILQWMFTMYMSHKCIFMSLYMCMYGYLK